MEEVAGLLRWRRGEPAAPRRLQLVLTERCNLRCLSCAGGEPTPADEELPDERLWTLVDEAVALGVGEIYLVGGEVLLRRGAALALMERIKAAGLLGDLTTNGTLIDRALADALVAMGWDRLQVSVDGADAATHDRLRPDADGGGSFDRVRAGVAALRAARDAAGADRPRLTLTAVLSNANVSQLAGMVGLAADWGADEVTFQALRSMSPRCGELALDRGQRERMDGWAADAVEIAATRGLLTNAGNFRSPAVTEHIGALDHTLRTDSGQIEDPILGAHCFAPWTTIVVHVDGAVSPCWEWAEALPATGGDAGRGGEAGPPPLPPMGNVRTDSLVALWSGAAYDRWRETFAAREVPAHCARCCLGFVDHLRGVRMAALLADDQPDAALALADAILAEDPTHRDAVDTRARALFAMKKIGDGIRWIRALAEDPASGDAAAYLLALVNDAGRHGDAREIATTLLHRDPPLTIEARAKVQRARVRSLYDTDRLPEARAAQAVVLRTATDAELPALAELLFEPHAARDRTFAVSLSDAVLSRNPGATFALWIRAAARGKLGDVDGALDDARQALAAPAASRAGFDDAIHDTLAELYLDAGDPERAIEHARRALELCPGKPESQRTLERATVLLEDTAG